MLESYIELRAQSLYIKSRREQWEERAQQLYEEDLQLNALGEALSAEERTEASPRAKAVLDQVDKSGGAREDRLWTQALLIASESAGLSLGGLVPGVIGLLVESILRLIRNRRRAQSTADQIAPNPGDS